MRRVVPGELQPPSCINFCNRAELRQPHWSCIKVRAMGALARTLREAPGSFCSRLKSCSRRKLARALINLQDSAQELGDIFAVAGGMIERIQARIHSGFRQCDAKRMRLVCENDFVPLNGGNLVVETCYGASAKKRSGCFRRIEDGCLDFLLVRDAARQAFAQQLIV